MNEPIPIATSTKALGLRPRMANRHGLIAGATGTGKTVTLRTLAEGFSDRGVPVFMADVKGDLSGLAFPGRLDEKLNERVRKLKLAGFSAEGYPVTYWDIFGSEGHPVRTTVSEMGPLLLGRLLNLNETQSGVLSLVFKIADDQGLLLLDLKDLRAMVQHAGEHASRFQTEYGNISAASIGAIQRGLLVLEEQGGDKFFGEPALNLDDLRQTAGDGRGVINILSAGRLMSAPKVYSTFLLWMLSELFETLPEVGDVEKPELVFFFDEAHLLFADAPPALLEKIEQVVRLIRSKGVGVYFVTQNPLDVPDKVLGQLGNRVQHALRAFTPRDQRAVRAAAETFRANPRLDVAEVITQLGVGEALVSLLDDQGIPEMVERAWVHPPRSRLQPVSGGERAEVLKLSTLQGVYERVVDRESAYEVLRGRATSSARPSGSPAPAGSFGGPSDWLPKGGMMEAFAKSAARAIGSQVGRQLVRGVLGSLLGGGFGSGRSRRY